MIIVRKEIKLSSYCVKNLEATLYMINVKLRNIVNIINVKDNEEVSRFAIKQFVKNLAIVQRDIKDTIRHIDRTTNNLINLRYACNIKGYTEHVKNINNIRITSGIYLDTFNTLRNANKAILTSYNKDFNFVNVKSDKEGILDINYKSISLVYKNIEMLHNQILGAKENM